MDICKKISANLKKIGQPVSFSIDEVTYNFYAHIQPIHDKSKLYLESTYSSLGKIDRSHALYYGPVFDGGELLAEGMIVTANSVHYLVKISEPFFITNKKAYIWAVLQRSFAESEEL